MHSSEWVYNEIMRNIEPDLMLHTISKHGDLYGDESDDEREDRMAAYDKAFMVFDQAYATIEKMFVDEIRKLRREAQSRSQSRERRERQNNLSTFERALDSFKPEDE